MNPTALIIGAGPAGCSCASWLALQGVSSVVIEQQAHPLPLLRALDLPQDWVLGAPGTSTAELAAQYERHLRANPLVRLRCGVSIAGVEQFDGARKALRLSDGSRVEGQVLVLATGLRSRAWPGDSRGARLPWDAVALTRERASASQQRVLLLGGGDNAVENALYLARRGNRVVLWSRGPLRAQAQLQAELAEPTLGIERRIGIPLPDTLEGAVGGWSVHSQDFGAETFDQVAVLFGFEPDDGAWQALRGSPAWRDAGFPSGAPLPAAAPELAARGVFLAGDVSERLHPSIQTALADGVTAARAASAWLARPADVPVPAPVPAQARAHVLMLEGLRFKANVGILDHEKEAPQPIQVDAELNLGAQPLLPRDDEIHHVLDYRKVRKIIIDECTAEHVNLLESLIGKLAHRLMQLPGVVGVRVRIAKLEIFDDCEVAIRVEAGRW